MTPTPLATTFSAAPDFDTALDDAIALLRAGVPLEDCADAYPAYAADLLPLLEAAQLTQDAATHTPSPLARARVRAAVMASAEARLARRSWLERAGLAGLNTGDRGAGGAWLGLRPAGIAAVAASGALLLGGGGTLVASASALPGDPLYPVKLKTEDVRLAVAQAAGDPAAQAALRTQLADRRLEEAQALASQGKDVPPGVVESSARHVAAAEAAAARAPEPQRAQIAAKIEDGESQRQQTLQRVLEQVPTPARAAIAQALEHERGRKDDRPATASAARPAASPSAAGAATPANATVSPSATAGASVASGSASNQGRQGQPEDRRDGEGGRGNGNGSGNGAATAPGNSAGADLDARGNGGNGGNSGSGNNRPAGRETGASGPGNGNGTGNAPGAPGGRQVRDSVADVVPLIPTAVAQVLEPEADARGEDSRAADTHDAAGAPSPEEADERDGAGGRGSGGSAGPAQPAQPRQVVPPPQVVPVPPRAVPTPTQAVRSQPPADRGRGSGGGDTAGAGATAAGGSQGDPGPARGNAGRGNGGR